jgi:arginyl-tRNA synthetase
MSAAVSGGGLMKDLREGLRTASCKVSRERFGHEPDSASLGWETPPEARFGDLSTPLALRLARVLRRPPLEIARSLRDGLADLMLPFVAEVTVSPPGFVNVSIDSGRLLDAVIRDVAASGDRYGWFPRRDEKVVIEHTNMNPNKAAHVGHVRNACLGDCLVRIMRRCGYDVEVQNYIDDTGAQVADVVLGLRHLGAVPAEGVRFDHYCWDLYADIHRRYETDPALHQVQQEYLHLIEAGDPEVAGLAKQVAERVLAGHLETMWGLNVHYDLLTWESDIVRQGFWRHAFETLRDRGSLTYETEGPNAGCWVVKLGDLPGFDELENPDKVLVRSNGTATYVAKDIAYQLWKFGVLGKDFHYRRYASDPDGQDLYSSCPPELAEQLPAGVGFGHADRVVNVIDIRQKYLQDVLRHSLRQLGYEREADNSVHFSYEVVALSPETAKELGGDVDSEAKGAVAMSGRKGIGVKADDLIEAAVAKARLEVSQRHPEMSAEETERLAHDIAVGAIRYYMVRFHTNTLIAFDFAEALAMQGHTGPYLQYAHARALSILRKAAGAVPGCPEEPAGALRWAAAQMDADAATRTALPVEKNLALAMADFGARTEAAAAELLPSILADYAYSLATAFTDFYEGAPVLTAQPADRPKRVALVAGFAQVMRNALEALGLPSPTVL